MLTGQETSEPQVLLLASRYDLTCDYIVAGLRRRSVPYWRLNSEDLQASTVELDPVHRRLEIGFASRSCSVSEDSLRAVFFRRPVFLRNYGHESSKPEERFSKHQWSAFVRNLMLFDKAAWINDPVATYRAEHKAVQLAIAASLGFAVPETRVTNAPYPGCLRDGASHVAVKGLDTVLLRSDGYELFGFTTIEPSSRLEPDEWRTAPATIQSALPDKLDIRVTVIDDRVFAACITAGGHPISGDWRRSKESADFSRFVLPPEVALRSRRLVSRLGLRFGGIDLALCGEQFYFLEINPTGEWGWLVDAARLPIDEAIVDALAEGMPSSVA